MRIVCLGLMAGLLALVCGCSTVAQRRTPDGPKDVTVLGEGQGTGAGFLLFGFIPIMQNGRYTRAFDEAVLSRGGTAIVDPTVHERWYWTPVGNGFVTTIRGTVVK